MCHKRIDLKKFSAMAVYGTILEKYSGVRPIPGSTLARRPTAVTARKNQVRAASKERAAIHGIRSCGLLDGPGVFQSTPGERRSHGVASRGPGSTRTRSMCSGARMDEIPHHQMGRKLLTGRYDSIDCGAHHALRGW